ncbi:MAG: thermosome subunit [Nitrososphaeria archaeon]|nr:thermosome subunit [Nitrososphaeria archaeon]NIN53370.1 thermosome subunit [Nitrososphaeria archaeon]NIQ33836.1 thermosome subunit [Nitrososphaeria archaeon]
MAQAIPAVTSGGQPILILKEGTGRSRGKEAQRRNIQAAQLVAEIIKSSLGPRGMDKMLVDTLGDVTVTNDGAAMLKEMDIEHPAAKMMVEIAKTTDTEVGDGTTSVVVLAGALLDKAQELIDKDVHPTLIIDGYKQAAEKALETYGTNAVEINPNDKEWLKKIAVTSMGSKLVAADSDFLADLAVDAILAVKEVDEGKVNVDIDDVKVEKKPGGSMRDTELIRGIALDKEVVHSGMPKRIKEPKIALINTALEIEKTEFDARINISSPDQLKLFLDEENKMLRDMIGKITATGANVALCQKGIDDVAQHYMAKEGILAIRRVKQSDMEKLSKATGARVVTNLEDLTENDLGEAEIAEERKIEDDKWVFIEGCKDPKSITLLIRGGSERVVDEAERSIHDALSVVKDVVLKPKIVAGGGAPESEAALQVREWATKLTGREQLAAMRFADALETIPLALAENAGLDTIDIETELRSKHRAEEIWAGVDVFGGKVSNMMDKDVVEPLAVKEQIVKASTEATSMILRIDDVIAATKMSGPPGGMPPGGMPPGGMPGGEEF